MRVRRLMSLCVVVCFLNASGSAVVHAEPVPHHGMAVEVRGPSEECLGCHDGMIARNVHFCTVNCSFKTSHSLFRKYPPSGKEDAFRPATDLKAEGIELVDGMVSCISCHNLKNPERFHLVMDNSGSRLCFACHVK